MLKVELAIEARPRPLEGLPPATPTSNTMESSQQSSPTSEETGRISVEQRVHDFQRQQSMGKQIIFMNNGTYPRSRGSTPAPPIVPNGTMPRGHVDQLVPPPIPAKRTIQPQSQTLDRTLDRTMDRPPPPALVMDSPQPTLVRSETSVRRREMQAIQENRDRFLAEEEDRRQNMHMFSETGGRGHHTSTMRSVKNSDNARRKREEQARKLEEEKRIKEDKKKRDEQKNTLRKQQKKKKEEEQPKKANILVVLARFIFLRPKKDSSKDQHQRSRAPSPEPKRPQRSFSLPRGLGFSRQSTRKGTEVRIPASRTTEFPSREQNYPTLSRVTPVDQRPPPPREFEPEQSASNGQDALMIPLQKGIGNTGNSCYWNALFQCFAATEPMSSFFINELYQKLHDSIDTAGLQERLHEDPGSEEVTLLFARMMEVLWRNQDSADAMRKVRLSICKVCPKFANPEQQDVAELLAAIQQVLTVHAPDAENDLATEDGIFRRIFCNVISESMVCNACHFPRKDRLQYETVIHLTPTNKRPNYFEYEELVVVNGSRRIYRRASSVNETVGVTGATKLVARETGSNDKNVLFFGLNSRSFSQCLVTPYDISRPRDRTDREPLYVTELDNTTLGSDGREIVTCLIVHAVRNARGINRVTEPFKCRLSISDNYATVVHKVLSASEAVCRVPTFDAVFDVARYLSIQIHDDNRVSGGTYLSPTSTSPLLHADGVRHMDEQTRIFPQLPRFMRLIVEWKDAPTHIFFPENDASNLVFHESFDYFTRHMNPTLHSCLVDYFKPELIDGWKCDNCEMKGLIKTPYIITPPPVIAIMVKRFGGGGTGPEATGLYKSTASMSLTYEQFDMSTFVSRDFTSGNKRVLNKSDLLYDVIGVICHNGTLVNGHWIAYCRNPVNNKWKKYDDMEVTPSHPNNIDGSSVYMIFLQRHSDRVKNMAKLQQGGLGIKRDSPSFFSMERWARNPLNNCPNGPPIPNGPLVVQNGKDTVRRSSSFRRDDTIRRPTSSASNAPARATPLPYNSMPRQIKPATNGHQRGENGFENMFGRREGSVEAEKRETEL